MDDNRLLRLAKAIGSARQTGCSLLPLLPYRLGVAASGTADLLVPAIEATAARHGLALECHSAGYDQALQESHLSDSALVRSAPDGVLIALDWRALGLRDRVADSAGAQASVDAALAYIESIRGGLRQNSSATIFVQNLAAPPERMFGSLDRIHRGCLRRLIDSFNDALADRLHRSGDVLFDVAGLAETVGLANWHSPAEWNLAKLPFAQAFVPLFADHLCRLVAAQRGLNRRCLVVDLDNTLWGGVIGDDGLQGIRIGNGDAVGEAYLSFQRYLLDLRDRGVVLAVSSKNEDETARLPFRKHPDMLLREEHFAVFQANWNDKATNIGAIARTLSLGLESFVFVDDNPFERNLVREALPAVAIPEMPEDPAFFARTLSAAGYFETATFSREDVERANYYAGNAQRAELERQMSDVASYLVSLDMEITFQPFDEAGRARIVQLIAKSNQFNLTTKRYSEAEVARMEADPACFTLQVRLRDKLGDNGMIGVVICRTTEPSVWEIDTWLMSCRVLGRRVEEAVLLEILKHGRRRGIELLVGTYRPTERNKLVEQHYAKLGFTLVEGGDGHTVWQLRTATAFVELPPMKVHSLGFDDADRGAVS